MDADEIRRTAREFLASGQPADEEHGAALLLQILAELAAHTATIAAALGEGNLNVDARVREGSHGH